MPSKIIKLPKYKFMRNILAAKCSVFRKLKIDFYDILLGIYLFLERIYTENLCFYFEQLVSALMKINMFNRTFCTAVFNPIAK